MSIIMKIAARIGDAFSYLKRMNRIWELRKYLTYLRKEQDREELSGEFRIKALIAVHDALHSGVSIEELDIQLTDLIALVTKIERRIGREIVRKQVHLERLGMTEDTLYSFFRHFLHELLERNPWHDHPCAFCADRRSQT
jgi:hypothetical protein